MSIINAFKSVFVTKHPTVKQDSIAYTSGAGKTYLTNYNTYVQSVEALDKAIRIIANVASMAQFKVYKDVNGTLKPLKVKNIDFQYNVNDQDSQGDLLSLMFSSIFTQGASILIAENNSKTKFINFYAYDPVSFQINASENRMIDTFLYTSKGGTQIPFKPEDVIYVAPRIDPSNLVYATSRLKPMNDLLTLQSSVMKQQTDYYSSGGKLSTIVSPKEPMGSEKAQQLKTAFDSFLATTATKTLFLNTEIDVSTVSNAQNPTQIMAALTTINKMVTEQFGIPSYLYGDYSGYVNDKAVTTAAKIFFQIQMKPIFNAIAFQMTKYFRNTLGLKDAVVAFDYTNVEILEDSLQTKIDNAATQYKLGIISMNEARVACELEPIDADAANRHFVPAYLTGQIPVSIETFDETVSKLFDSSVPTIPTDSGTTGGADNTNPISNSQGGANGT